MQCPISSVWAGHRCTVISLKAYCPFSNRHLKLQQKSNFLWGFGRWHQRGAGGETSTPNLTEGFHVCQRRDEINMYLYKKEASISDVVHKPVLSWLSVLPCASSEQFSVNVMSQECAGKSGRERRQAVDLWTAGNVNVWRAGLTSRS